VVYIYLNKWRFWSNWRWSFFQTNNIVNCNIKDFEIATRLDKDSYHTTFQQKLMQDKVEAEQLSSMRLLNTNLILIMFYVITNLFLLISGKNWQLFCRNKHLISKNSVANCYNLSQLWNYLNCLFSVLEAGFQYLKPNYK
jgi:hypothetical protein